jgi:RNA polymerase sigma-70 factor (ECF subfamily)
MEQCIAQFSGLVWNLVKRRVLPHSVAEDLVQEIFTEIWKSAARFDPAQGSEVTFIGIIARRRVIDWMRKQMRMPVLEVLPDNFNEVAVLTSTADSMECDSEQLAQVVAALPAQTQRLFHLHFDQGLTQHEIAELIGMPLGTVKSMLRRGLIEAKSILQRNQKSNPMPAR